MIGTAKSDRKAHEQRMSGAVWARDYIKREGMEAFEKQLKYRNAAFIPLEADDALVNKQFDLVVNRIYNSTTTGVCVVLNKKFKFGGERLKRFRDEFNEMCKDLYTVDGYGERYYSLKDYAQELNEKYGMDIDMDKVEEVDVLTENSLNRKADMHTIEQLLMDHGYGEAAAFLVQYMNCNFADEVG